MTLKLEGGNQGRRNRAELTKEKKTVETLEVTELQFKGETMDGINPKKNRLGLSELKLKWKQGTELTKKKGFRIDF
jgi:hypothetical protein